ncbi:MAG: hypothetical protein FJZ58_04850 [Chlamydiae bacterium]|nr:hypothetical protein [Chlamydiota bacterium]
MAATPKKTFHEVQAPFTATKIQLYAGTPEELDGKVVRIDLTRNLRGKGLELQMKVRNNDGQLVAEPIALELAGSYIRRMIRKGTDYVEDSFTLECKDAKAIVKPFLITRNKVSRALRNTLRLQARAHLESFFKTRTPKEAFTDITTNKAQRELSLKLKKIYPLALCEIRVFKLA